MRKIILFFAVQVREENLVFIFSEQLKETMNAILNGEILKTHWVRESTVGENPKKISSSMKYISLNIDLWKICMK